MTEHVGLPVEGYKTQTSSAVAIVNNNKRLEENILRQLDWMEGLEQIDKYWLAAGRLQLEQAFMSINRAVFKPGRAKLVGEE